MIRTIGFAIATAVAAATLVAATVSSSAFAEETKAAEMPLTASKPADETSRLRLMPADALKSGYLICERVISQVMVDSTTLIECNSVFEELRGRVFGGDLDAFTAWLRAAWNGSAPSR